MKAYTLLMLMASVSASMAMDHYELSRKRPLQIFHNAEGKRIQALEEEITRFKNIYKKTRDEYLDKIADMDEKTKEKELDSIEEHKKRYESSLEDLKNIKNQLEYSKTEIFGKSEKEEATYVSKCDLSKNKKNRFSNEFDNGSENSDSDSEQQRRVEGMGNVFQTFLKEVVPSEDKDSFAEDLKGVVGMKGKKWGGSEAQKNLGDFGKMFFKGLTGKEWKD